MEEEIKIKKSKKMRKLEKKINKLTEKNNITPKKSIEKKITKLEKKKLKLEKWLKIKLPFRILIKGLATWLIIGGVCYGCSYVPVVREVKMVTMATLAYVAPEPVAKVLDVITLNVGASNNDFEWLKTTLKAYMNEEVKLETNHTDVGIGTGYTYDGESYDYRVNGQKVTEEEYNQYVAQENEKLENMAQDVLGTTDINTMSTMSISEILMKVATNSTPEIISQLLDMSNLTYESRQKVEQDINRALKILKKLNNNQMNELIEIINERINIEEQKYNENKLFYQKSEELAKKYNQLMEKEQELFKQYSELIQNGNTEKADTLSKEIHEIELEAVEIMIQKYTNEYELAVKEGDAHNMEALKGYIRSFEEQKAILQRNN